MRFFLLSAKAAVKKYLNIPLCAVLFAYIAVISAYMLYSGIYDSPPVDIGLYGNYEDDITLKKFAEGIGGAINIIYYGDMEKMKADALKNKIQAGYVFQPEDGEIDIYLTRQARSTPVINLLLSALLIQGKSGETGWSVIREYSEESEKEYAVSEIQRLSDDYLNTPDNDALKIEYANSSPLGAFKSENAVYFYIHVFFWLFIFLILAADALYMNKKSFSGCFTAMKVSKKIYLSGQLSGAFAISAAFFALSVTVLFVLG